MLKKYTAGGVGTIETLGVTFPPSGSSGSLVSNGERLFSPHFYEGLTDGIHHILLFSGRLGCVFDRPDY